jgi:carboxylesterase type B
MEFAHIQKALPVPQLQQSGTECLNLNITTPSNVAPESNLPVIVFLHGGGYAIGSNAWPQYDFRRIVALSMTNNRPVIGVNIKYVEYFIALFIKLRIDAHLKLSLGCFRIPGIPGA